MLYAERPPDWQLIMIIRVGAGSRLRQGLHLSDYVIIGLEWIIVFWWFLEFQLVTMDTPLWPSSTSTPKKPQFAGIGSRFIVYVNFLGSWSNVDQLMDPKRKEMIESTSQRPDIDAIQSLTKSISETGDRSMASSLNWCHDCWWYPRLRIESIVYLIQVKALSLLSPFSCDSLATIQTSLTIWINDAWPTICKSHHSLLIALFTISITIDNFLRN